MLLCDKLRTRSLGLASEGVIFMPSIVKVDKMVHSHAHAQTHTYVHARTHARSTAILQINSCPSKRTGS